MDWTYYLSVLREMGWAYYLPLAIVTVFGVSGAIGLKRAPAVVRLLFLLVCPVFGLAGEMATYIHTAPQTYVLFGVAVLCAVIAVAIQRRYAPYVKAARKT